jgi:hypothetical protein
MNGRYLCYVKSDEGGVWKQPVEGGPKAKILDVPIAVRKYLVPPSPIACDSDVREVRKADREAGCTIGIVLGVKKGDHGLLISVVRCLFMFTRFQSWRAAVGLSIVLAIASEPGRAVDPDQPATSYLRTTFTVEDGLSSNVVNASVSEEFGCLLPARRPLDLGAARGITRHL